MQDILILGAGELGTAIIQSLASHNHFSKENNASITVAVRNPVSGTDARAAKFNTLKSQGVNFLQLDIASSSDTQLQTLFEKYHTMIGCLGFAAGSGVQLKVARTVVAAKVPRYIPWQFGIDYDIVGRGSTQPLFDEQLDVRDLLRAQTATEWIVVQTGVFTSFMFEPMWGVVDMSKDTVRALGSWDTGISATTPEDIGVVVAALLFDEGEWEKYRNSKVNVAGDTRTYGEIADVIERVASEKRGSKAQLVREEWTVPALTEEWKRDSEDVIKRYRPVFAAGKGVAWDHEKTYNVTRGFKATTIEDYARGWMK